MRVAHSSSCGCTLRPASAPAVAHRHGVRALASIRDNSTSVGTRDAAAGHERRDIINELQRLRTQKDKLREQLEERERILRLREDQTADALHEEEAASSSQKATGMCSSRTTPNVACDAKFH
jgi:hypothetical protein